MKTLASQNRFTFGELEREIILHKLCDTTSIRNAMHAGGMQGFGVSEITAAIEQLINWLGNAGSREEINLSPRQLFVARWCCTHSIFFAEVREESEDGNFALADWRNAAESLEKKLNVKIPRY